ncbi:hypothetical protein DL93DRAFT_2070164 [Clavulina sp. PMI_390]|nr:hypothetical protein DL93DRAFT_2070164 [Clavulina sp. PMI_390]
MRQSAVARSGMPTGKLWMGWWGDFGGPTQKGITSYSVSSLQQRAFKGAISGYLFNGFSRLSRQAPYFALPLGTGMHYFS